MVIPIWLIFLVQRKLTQAYLLSSCLASSWMLGGKLLKNEAIFMLGSFSYSFPLHLQLLSPPKSHLASIHRPTTILGLGMAETCYESGHASQIDAGSDVREKRFLRGDAD
jgi:hypothetical protein